MKFSAGRKTSEKTGHPARTGLAMAIVVLALMATGCQTVQTTEAGKVGVTRSQLMGVSSEEINAASSKAYGQLLQEAERKKQLNQDPQLLARVRTIAERLIEQTGVFRAEARQWRWETNVFHSGEINAFCMAGGKIGVYSGLVDKLKLTDDELAAVMGHEMAHALREHVREQVSMRYAAQLPGMVLAIVTGSRAMAELGDMVSNVTLALPRSREAEREADVIGVELAARAGYDPRAAISLWQKMNRQGGSRPPEFLSTHPAPESREQDLAKTSEVVLPLYKEKQQKQ